MAADIPALLGALRDSVTAPARTAERLLARPLPAGVLAQGLVLVACVNALILGIANGGAIPIPVTATESVALPPLVAAALVAGGLALGAAAIQAAGRALGGTGTFAGSLAVAVWLEVLAIAVSLVQVVVALALPPLLPAVGLAGAVVLLWCLLQFVRVLHGFAGPGRAALAVLLGALGVVLGLAVLGAVLGGTTDV